MAKFIQGANGILKMVDIPGSADPYDESIYYDSGLAATTNITLPNSGSFSDSGAADLIVILNKKVVEITRDFTVVGGGPSYTQIQFVYELPDDSVVNFKQGI